MTPPRWQGRLRQTRNRVEAACTSTSTTNPGVTLKHSLIYSLSGPQDSQDECVLFSTIPPEIRSMIFSLALSSYDDKSRPYADDAYFSRPGYRFPHVIDTSLLATCRRIYTETHDLPVSLNEHVFWHSGSRGPSFQRLSDNPVGYFKCFTEEQRAALDEVHLHTQLFWLEGGEFRNVCNSRYMKPRHLKITIRHTDWWGWEDNTPLQMQSEWTKELKLIYGLETLEVELETMERDKAQMEAIAKTMFKWSIALTDGRTLTTEGNSITRSRYLGQSSFGDHPGSVIYYQADNNSWLSSWSGFGINAIQLPTPPAPLPYVTATLRWTANVSS